MIEKIIFVVLLVSSIFVFCLANCITIKTKNKTYHYGTFIPEPDPDLTTDLITLEYRCPHDHRWGIYLDFGYKRWFHEIFGKHYEKPKK